MENSLGTAKSGGVAQVPLKSAFGEIIPPQTREALKQAACSSLKTLETALHEGTESFFDWLLCVVES